LVAGYLLVTMTTIRDSNQCRHLPPAAQAFEQCTLLSGHEGMHSWHRLYRSDEGDHDLRDLDMMPGERITNPQPRAFRETLRSRARVDLMVIGLLYGLLMLWLGAKVMS